MKSESKKFEKKEPLGRFFTEPITKGIQLPDKVIKAPLKKWFISYEIWQYVQCFTLTEKKSEKIEANNLEEAIDKLKWEHRRLIILNVIEL